MKNKQKLRKQILKIISKLIYKLYKYLKKKEKVLIIGIIIISLTNCTTFKITTDNMAEGNKVNVKISTNNPKTTQVETDINLNIK